MSMCKAVLTGKVVRDPEKRFTTGNVSVTTFSINVETPKSEGHTNIVRVIAWRNLADTCAETVKKGQTVIVEGRLQVNSYKDATGADKKGLELEANDVMVLSTVAKPIVKESSNSVVDNVPPPTSDDYDISTNDLIDEEEIPF